MNRFQVKQDGRTPFIKIMKKPYRGEVVCFGEHVMYRVVQPTTAKLEPRWFDAVWVGKAHKSDEHILLTDKGVVKARALKRRAVEERFSMYAIRDVCGLPWSGDAKELTAPC